MYPIKNNMRDKVVSLEPQKNKARQPQAITSNIHTSSAIIHLLYIDNNPTQNPSFDSLFRQNQSFEFELEWTQAQTLEKALQYLQEQAFEVILLSLDFPNHQVLEILKTLKAQVPNAPIIAVTPPEEKKHKLALECIKNGAKNYLIKNLDILNNQVDQQLFFHSLCNAIECLRTQQELRSYQTKLQKINQELQEKEQEKIISDQLMEERLKTSEAQMRGFLDAINDIVLILEIKTQDIQVVPTRSEMIYQNTADIIQETINLLTDDESAENFWQVIERSLTSKTSLDLEYCLSLNSQELWFSTRISPLSKEQVIWVARDISTHKQSQEQLQKQLAAIEAAIDGIALLKEGKFIYLNSAHVDLFGYDNPEELLGQNWQELYSHAEITRFEQEVFPQLAQQRFWRGEATATRKDGTTFAEDVSLTLAADGTLICVCRDITERKNAEQEIFKTLKKEQELSELKSNFITTMSHEFRTPLAIISSSAGILETFDHKLSEDQKQKHFQKIKAQIQHIINLLDNILLINQAEASQLTFNPKPLNLVHFCQTLTQEMQRSHLNTHQINFIFKKYHQLSQAVVDEKLLRHILTHLLSNAIKYSPDGADIDFCLSLRENWISLQVRDLGIGIPLKEQKQVFQSFYRAQNVGTIQGTGLGLSIVKKCLDLHSGCITVESELGEGTTFTVTLPLIQTEEL